MRLDPRWVHFADEDLKMASLAFEAKIWNQACFHAQQAAEKLLKATFEQGVRPRTHKLGDLARSAPIRISSPLVEALFLLDRFYIPTPFPGPWKQVCPRKRMQGKRSRRPNSSGISCCHRGISNNACFLGD